MQMMFHAMDSAVKKDIKTLIAFIHFYCSYQHPAAAKKHPQVKSCDLDSIYGRSFELCEECRRLLIHAVVKRSNCPMDPKPSCKHCPVHCYHPSYRAQIREVMRYSGKGMLLRGRLDYILHLLF
jgi:hypothetical protein